MMSRKIGLLVFRLFLAVALISVMAACSSNKKKLKPVKLKPIQAEVKIDKLWSRTLSGGLGKYYQRFELAQDSSYIYAASAKGKVYKTSKDKDKLQWRVSLKTPLTTGVGLGENNVYVAGLAGVVIALDKQTGKEVWNFQADGEILSPPQAYNGHVVFQTTTGEVYDLNSTDGSKRWSKPTTQPLLSLRGTSRALFFADFVIIGLASGKLEMYDLATGQLRWQVRVAEAKGNSEIERLVDVDSTPILEGNYLYSVAYQGQLAAFDMSNANKAWSVDESSYQDIDAGFGSVYVSSADSELSAYDQQTGLLRWTQDGLLRRKITAPTVVGAYVVVADYQGYIHLLSPDDGRFVARKRLSHQAIRNNILADGNRFYVVDNKGHLKAYQIGKTIHH